MKKGEKNFKKVLSEVLPIMEMVENDRMIPRNIKNAVQKARERLTNEEDGPVVKASAAIYILDEISNDINLPGHARALIWNILSLLETIKE